MTYKGYMWRWRSRALYLAPLRQRVNYYLVWRAVHTMPHPLRARFNAVYHKWEEE